MTKDLIQKCMDEVQRGLSTASPLDKTLEITLDTAIAVARCKEGGALLVSDDSSSLQIQVYRGRGVEGRSRLLALEGPVTSNCAHAFRKDKSLLIPDVAKSPAFYARSDSDIQSELIVPVRSRGKITGLINLESTETGHFTPEHLAAVEQLCDSVGLIWNMAILIEWRNRAQKLHAALQRVATSLLDGNDGTDRVVLEEALALTSADIGGILTRSIDGDYLELTDAMHLREGVDRSIPKGQGIVWRCLQERHPISVPDVREDPDFLDLSDGKIKSLLTVPMFDREEAIGVINIESQEINHFDLSDKSVLRLFASHAALSVKLAKLRSQYEGAASLAVLGSLSGNITHRMNNLIGGVRVLSDLLAGDLVQQAPELVPRAREIEASTTEALGVVEHYEKLFSVPKERLDLRDVVDKLVADITKPQSVEIRTRYPDQPVEYLISSQQIADLLRELITNALKALRDGGLVEIKIDQTPTAVRLHVSDNGPGIDEGALPRIFDKGFTDRKDHCSTGFGLWWVRTSLAMMGGTVVPSGNPGGGACFTVVLPKTLKQ